jgi:phage shock protein PspC (stress-responsive transcriptional regulator)
MKWNVVLEKITEIISWIQIAISPTLAGIAIGLAVYFTNPTTIRLIIGCCIGLAGLVIGITYANHIFKTRGTMNFVSRISSSPELDHLDEEDKNKP